MAANYEMDMSFTKPKCQSCTKKGAEIARLKDALAEMTKQDADRRNGVRPGLMKFVYIMERELRRNDHKRGWEKDSLTVLYARLQEEVAELFNEITYIDSVSTPERIAKEAADVANFAMMIADVAVNYTAKEEK